MEYLPKIEYTEKRPSTIYIPDDQKQYQDFLGRVQEFIVGDCWAIVINDEILFNSYKPMTVKEQIQDNIIRHELREYPNTIFIDMIKKKKNGRVDIYMYGDTPWFVVIHFNDGIIKMDYYKSNKYVKYYE